MTATSDGISGVTSDLSTVVFRGDLTAAQVVFAPSVLSTLSYMDIPNPSLVSRRFGLLWVGEAFLAKCLKTVQVQDKILVSPSEGLAEFLGNPLILLLSA